MATMTERTNDLDEHLAAVPEQASEGYGARS
jgi:hypothetical protein